MSDLWKSEFWNRLGLTTQGKKIAAISVGGLVLATGTYLILQKKKRKVKIKAIEKSAE